MPGRTTPAVHLATLAYAEVERSGTVFAVLDPPADQSATDIVTYVTTTAALEGASEFGAIYWPRLKVLNPAKSVFGSELSVEVANVQYFEGGSLIPNKSPGRLTISDVTLERGATEDHELFDWFQDVAVMSIGLGLVDSDYKRNLDIVQQDRDGATLRRWTLTLRSRKFRQRLKNSSATTNWPASPGTSRCPRAVPKRDGSQF